MGFLRRTFTRRFAMRERVERDSNGGAGGVTGNPLLLPHQQQVVHAPAVVTGGGSAHIQAAGTARSSITCRVLLLDGRDLVVDLPVSSGELTVVNKVKVARQGGQGVAPGAPRGHFGFGVPSNIICTLELIQTYARF